MELLECLPTMLRLMIRDEMNMKRGEKMEVKKMEMKKGRRIGLTIAATTLALLFCVILSASTVGATTVKVDPATQDVTPGDAFSVNVSVEDVTYMGADQATLNFDQGVMSVTGVTEGDFLKTGGGTVGAGMEIIDNVTGKVTFFYSLTGGPGIGVNGSGTLATIYFDTDSAAAPGVYNLDLTDVMLADGDGNEMPEREISNGTINIKAPAPPAAVPGLSGTGFIAAIGLLAVVLAISVSATRKRRK